MSAVVVSVALFGSFAAWLTLHVALAYGLIRHGSPRLRLLWLLLPPLVWLAPYWGFRHRLRGLSIVWLACGVAYVALLVVGSRWPTQ